MLDNTQHSNCGFAEELVSYLYDELKSSDKPGFEKHLETCSTCQEELAGFSMTRNSILEWRKVDFSPLPNPLIEIKFPPKTETISRGWLVTLRSFFTLSPAWLTASTAFAALAICLVLFAVMVSSLRDNGRVAKKTDKGNTNIITTPTVGNQNNNSNVSNTNQNKPNPAISPEPVFSSPLAQRSAKPVEPTKVLVKPTVSTPQNLPVRTIQPIRPKPRTDNSESPRKIKNQRTKAPSFLDEEEEQKSLTLTDLLEEVGMKEKDEKR